MFMIMIFFISYYFTKKKKKDNTRIEKLPKKKLHVHKKIRVKKTLKLILNQDMNMGSNRIIQKSPRTLAHTYRHKSAWAMTK